MAMIAGVVKETLPGERRVALTPTNIPPLVKDGWEVMIETGAGVEAGFTDAAYQEKGAKIAAARAEVFAAAEVVLQVRALGANLEQGATDLELIRSGQVLIGFCEPLTAPAAAQQVAARGGALFAMELIPRITRAQSMDALSSMASIAGYKAVLLAASTLPKIFPMMMTAAGTISPSKVFVVGAGVAGLQAIATARGWAPWSRPTTCGRWSRSRWKASAAASSICRWRRRRLRIKGAMPGSSTKASISGSEN